MDNVNYRPPYFKPLKNIFNDDTIRPVNNVVPCTVNIDDDVISEFNTKINGDGKNAHTIMSDSCVTVVNILKKINESNDSCGGDNGKPLQLIELVNSTMFTDICEDNLTVDNEKKMNKNALEFNLQ